LTDALSFDHVARKRKAVHMEAATRSLVVGVFDERWQAEKAIDKLWHAGFQKEQVGVLTPGGKVEEATTPTGKMEDQATKGAVGGAATGAGVGAVAGAAASLLIPGVGPVIAGGLLFGTALGAAGGAALGTFLGPFLAMEAAQDEASTYENDLRAGRSVVLVKAGDMRDQAVTILRGNGARVHATAAARPTD
jgi:hypothetical protein